jgi:hypothetical protein
LHTPHPTGDYPGLFERSVHTIVTLVLEVT